MSEPLLSVRNLRTHFFTKRGVVKAVDDVSFDIHMGKTFGLVGETGCGKSVTALSVMGLVPHPGRVVGGEVWFKDRNLLEMGPEELRDVRGKEISMIFQDPLTSLNPVFTVGYQVDEPLIFHKNLDDWLVEERTQEMLSRVGIPSPSQRRKNYPHQFSGGMRQRAMIAMALMCNPDLLIADEPTTALDVTIQAQILEMLKGLRENLDLSVLLITHNFGVVAEMCDRIAVMYAGNIVEVADAVTLFENPIHPYTRGLMMCLPSVDRKIDRLASIDGVVPSLIDPPVCCRFHNRCNDSTDLCSKNSPQLMETEPDHYVACFQCNGV
ncbi:MAG: ABC transporter ATP-binding protein [Candidatus Bathyarchaeia archaeon]